MRTTRPGSGVPHVATLLRCNLATRPAAPASVFMPAPRGKAFKVINTASRSLITLITFQGAPKNHDVINRHVECRPATHHSASAFRIQPSAFNPQPSAHFVTNPANPTRIQTPKTPTPPRIREERRLGGTPKNLDPLPRWCENSSRTRIAGNPLPPRSAIFHWSLVIHHFALACPVALPLITLSRFHLFTARRVSHSTPRLLDPFRIHSTFPRNPRTLPQPDIYPTHSPPPHELAKLQPRWPTGPNRPPRRPGRVWRPSSANSQDNQPPCRR